MKKALVQLVCVESIANLVGKYVEFRYKNNNVDWYVKGIIEKTRFQREIVGDGLFEMYNCIIVVNKKEYKIKYITNIKLNDSADVEKF